MQHQRLGAVEHVAAAVAARRGRDVGKVVARLPFGMREGKTELARGDLRQQLGALRVASRQARMKPPPSTTVAR